MSDIAVTVALVRARDPGATGRARGLQPDRRQMRCALAVTLSFTVGCLRITTAATIHRTDGPPIEAEIDSSDASTLRLRRPDGTILALGQYQVARIEHPGNVTPLSGAYYAGGCLLLTAAWIETERANPGMRNDREELFAYLMIGAAVVGLVSLVPHMLAWGGSKAHARVFEQSRPPEWLMSSAVPGEAEPIQPLRPPPGADDEDPNEKPPGGFHR